ncbi:Modification methylase DpnIIA [bioreactor metagenome]|uniref:site-specific DNA-methyltransferase (adenine-specific) n=1 Tax=bioreactor metagenome TaxID=1076179 RepID=A0A644WRP3_9ZZZZ
MAKRNILVSPFVKWVGGKRQLIPEILEHLPQDIQKYKYIEPFIGGGAVFFHLQLKNAIINDFNEELINVYSVIRDQLDELIADLSMHKNDSDYFYKLRNVDRTPRFKKLSPVQRASRIIYLNKTCYNGLYRVNNSGEFNSPFGRYKNPNIINGPTLKAVSKYLNTSNVTICCGDYREVLKKATKSSFVYLDPPYHPVSDSANFTGYIQGGWTMEDQIKLRIECDKLNQRGVKFLLSNSATDFIREQYKNYTISTVRATRAINSNPSNRGEVEELLVQNYE